MKIQIFDAKQKNTKKVYVYQYKASFLSLLGTRLIDP